MAAAARQQRRRPGVPARGDDAEARHRPPDAGRARRLRDALEDEPVRGAVRRFARHGAERRGRSARCTSSAAASTTSPSAPARPRGAEDAKALLLGWLKDIGYEAHLHDDADSEKLAASRWANVLDFVDWIARRCGGEIENDGIATFESETEERARGGADDLGDPEPGRARRRAGRASRSRRCTPPRASSGRTWCWPASTRACCRFAATTRR